MSADAASAVVVVDDAAKKQVILDNIRGVPDFPIPGILFWYGVQCGSLGS